MAEDGDGPPPDTAGRMGTAKNRPPKAGEDVAREFGTAPPCSPSLFFLAMSFC